MSYPTVDCYVETLPKKLEIKSEEIKNGLEKLNNESLYLLRVSINKVISDRFSDALTPSFIGTKLDISTKSGSKVNRLLEKTGLIKNMKARGTMRRSGTNWHLTKKGINYGGINFLLTDGNFIIKWKSSCLSKIVKLLNKHHQPM